MRLASFAFVAVFATTVILRASLALAEQAAPSREISCGATSREAIAAAEKALNGKSSEDQQRALACLLAAVKRLDAERLDSVNNNKVRMLNVPRTP